MGGKRGNAAGAGGDAVMIARRRARVALSLFVAVAILPGTSAAPWLGCGDCRPTHEGVAAWEKFMRRHVVCQDHVTDLMKSHLTNHINHLDDGTGGPVKHPLNMIAVGPPGIGKSLMFSQLADALYGSCKETCRHQITFSKDKVSSDFQPEVQRLRSGIKQFLSERPYGIVEVEDAHHADPGLLDFLCEFTDNSAKHNNAIFLISVNDDLGLQLINNFMLDDDRWMLRDEIDGTDVHDLLLKMSGKLLESKASAVRCLAQQHSISALVPFLPMDRECVKKCLKLAFEAERCIAVKKEFYGDVKLSGRLLNHIARTMVSYDDYGRFSKGGCKWEGDADIGKFCQKQLGDSTSGSPKVTPTGWFESAYYKHRMQRATLKLKDKHKTLGDYEVTVQICDRDVSSAPMADSERKRVLQMCAYPLDTEL